MNQGVKKLILTLLIVFLMCSSAGAAYYWMNLRIEKQKNESENALKNLESEKEQLTKEKEKLNQQIKELKKEVVDLKKQVEKKTNLSNTKDKTRPTVKNIAGPKRDLSIWKFKFSEAIEKSTLIPANINLYAVGGSVGTAGQKTLDKQSIKSLDYNEKDFILTITVDTNSLKCASCTHELVFTDKIKDLAGNTLIEKVFPF